MPRTDASSAVRVHVTGASGFLGAELVRRAPQASGERVELRDADALRALFERLRPDVVVNTAYRQGGADAWAITVDGAENVARAARGVGARLLQLSTDVVFSGRKGAPYLETDEVDPVSEYGRAKAESERRVLQAYPDALVVRTSLLVGGPGHAPSRHELAAREPAMTFYEDEIRCPTQVGDLAAALLELAALEITGVLHVAGGDRLSRVELAEIVSGRPVPHGPAPPGRPLDCSLDCSLAGGLLRTTLRGARELFAPDAKRDSLVDVPCGP